MLGARVQRLFTSKASRFIPNPGVARNDAAGYFGIFINYALTLKTNNYGQGFPDFPPPDFVLESLAKTASLEEAACHQYSRPLGLVSLNDEIAQDFTRLFNRSIDPNKEVFVSNGAAGVFSSFCNAFLQPGDELVTFEPSYVYYLNALDILGIKVKYVPLFKENGKMVFDKEVLKSQFSSKTKAFMINTPHNPTSKVFTREELEFIASVLRQNPDVIVLSDEVYYNFTYSGQGRTNEHTFLATLPGMFDRTLSIYSFGKTFSCTGWKVGFGIGPEHLIKYMNSYQTFMLFCTNVPAMRAAALSLQKARLPYRNERNYYVWARIQFQDRKDRIVNIFRNLYGFDIIEPEGGYFCLADVSKAANSINPKFFYKNQQAPADCLSSLEKAGGWRNLPNPDYSADYAYGIHLCLERGLTPWPLSGFYDNEIKHRPVKDRRGTEMIRLSLCKSDQSIERLRKEGQAWKDSMSSSSSNPTNN